MEETLGRSTDWILTITPQNSDTPDTHEPRSSRPSEESSEHRDAGTEASAGTAAAVPDPALALPSFPAPPDWQDPDPERALQQLVGEPEPQIARANIGLAITGAVLFLPVGAFGLWQSLAASGSISRGQTERAFTQVGRGRTLSIVAVCVGAVGWLLLFPLVLILALGAGINGSGIMATHVVSVSPAPGASHVSVEITGTTATQATYSLLLANGETRVVEFQDEFSTTMELQPGEYAEIQLSSDDPDASVACSIRTHEGRVVSEQGSTFALCGVNAAE
ncbi:hypothetical protein D9V32_06315 [Mycetocola tolaasinivorans]|uniref:Uncharacterized protein n=1 Tax=Mycetocola tolaasinivorans TaxID=76635 RepID=A0A3L7A809_9MICO|nr:hypothetical protein [Mycetocola tolaasinivorans]RLP76469.1 hypothetical protein D9V32_06315 [Mycetocola tolaasinivorans]